MIKFQSENFALGTIKVKQYNFIVAAFAITMHACTAPGIFPQISPPPTADSNAISTMIVQTAQVLASQTAAATALMPAPTLIPATETIVPKASTSIPVLPTLNISTLNNTSVNILDDHSTRYIDNPAGFELTLPPGWLAMRVNGPEYFEAWTQPKAVKPEIQAFLSKIQNQNGNIFRLFAIDTREEHFQHQFVTNINLVWDQQDNKSLEETLDQIKAQYPVISPGIAILNIGIQANGSKSQYGLIESELKAKNELGEDFGIYQWQAILKLETGTLIISLSTTTDLKGAERVDFDNIVGSFQQISP